MNILRWLKGIISSAGDASVTAASPSTFEANAGDNYGFIGLVRAAQEDSDIRKSVLGIAAILDDFHRGSLLSEYQRSLLAQQAPRELVEAIEFLKDREICKKIKGILE